MMNCCAVRALLQRTTQHQPHFARSSLPARRFAAGVQPDKLPPEVEKMLKELGIKLPPGAITRIEVKGLNEADLGDLPSLLKDVKSQMKKAQESKKEPDLPQVIAMPPPVSGEASVAADSDAAARNDESSTAGRKLRSKGKSQAGAQKNASPLQGLVDLFAGGKGMKSIVVNGPSGLGEDFVEADPERSLYERAWHQKQLLGSSAENPIDLNYFDRASSEEFAFALFSDPPPSHLADIEISWPRDLAVPSKVRVKHNVNGDVAEMLIPFAGDPLQQSIDVDRGEGEKFKLSFCIEDLPTSQETQNATTLYLSSAAGHFFSSEGAVLRRNFAGSGEQECDVSGATVAANTCYTTDHEDSFHVSEACLDAARRVRAEAYAALAGKSFNSSAFQESVPSADTESSKIGAQVKRLLGGPVTDMAQLEDNEEQSANPLAMMGMQSSRTFKVEHQVKTRFSDVLGQEVAVEKLREFVDILQYPDSYDVIGSKVPKGGLLVGPPGTGKTLVAQAVAGECQLPFISVQGSEFNESLVGSGPRNVRALFKAARKQAALHGGCIVFIDEIDSIGRSRSQTDNSSASQGYCDTLNQLLAEIDGFHSKADQIVLLAATNRARVLDKALLRAGRFDRVIPMERPNLKEREELFNHYVKRLAWHATSLAAQTDSALALSPTGPVEEIAGASGMQIHRLNFQTQGTNAAFTDRLQHFMGSFVKSRVELQLRRKSGAGALQLRLQQRSILRIGSKFYVANDEDVASAGCDELQALARISRAAAKMTTGLTGASISSICNEAGIMAVREKIRENNEGSKLIVTSVAPHHIFKAIDFVAAGSEKRNFQIAAEERSSLAYHEAGHTVAAFLLEAHPDPVKVTIVPRDSGSLGFMMPGEPLSEVRQSKAQLEAKLCVLMGGRIAEEMFCNDVGTGASGDIEQATDLARQYVSMYGMGAAHPFLNTSDERWLSEATRAKRDEQIVHLLGQCYEKATALLSENRSKVEQLKDLLLDKETLLADEIRAALQ